MLNFFGSRPLIEESSLNWIVDTFYWALENFDACEFFERSVLVQPNNQFFPGRVGSVEALAKNIWESTVKYAGVTHFPFDLQAPEQYLASQPETLRLTSIQRNSILAPEKMVPTSRPWYISYNPHQTQKPEDLSSNFAHVIAQHLAFEKSVLPPGGEQFFNQATEVLAIVMGFGVMMVNSAHTYRGGCGSCYNPFANRKSSLYEDDTVFALALFCYLKGIKNKEATKYLKKHLKSAYIKAERQIKRNPEKFNQLLAFSA